ncbi:STM4011 family radical SAM protein [Catellatospora tritici]|uniref:STM4011 family radical SAM protein n=1 Tax=Catellatospora tritici TaxID=2851566 RepID=UPI001C2D6304|nr:STM4011 family radical SAM protein [Catellatospora tritici]MBV1856174.1 STM4011 family radical SAM protein [Catellatospora tritici]
MNLSILYRGPLASCDYDCPYCPFAKRRDSREQLRADRAALARFVTWVRANPAGDRISVLFTPWGEGLVRSWYRRAMVELSQLPQVDRVAIQTNLSGRLDWLLDADAGRVALWATYHPGQVARERFLGKVSWLAGHGIRHSVGMVGLPEHLAEARAVRELLPEATYLWVNAAEGHRYDAAAEAEWTAIDPLFGYSVRPHASLGHECRAGETALSVLGDGTVRRCHFLPEPLGNLYDGSYRAALRPRGCTKAECDCHIGYVHLKRLDLYQVFAGGVLERVPANPGPTWGAPVAATSAPAAGTPPR